MAFRGKPYFLGLIVLGYLLVTLSPSSTDNFVETRKIEKHEPPSPNSLTSIQNFDNMSTKHLNANYSGLGTSLEYLLQSQANGSVNPYNYLSSQNVYTQEEIISVPEDASMSYLNFTLSDFEIANDSLQIGNNSITGIPSYNITYTNNSVADAPEGSLNSLSWINITLTQFETSPLGEIQININSVSEATFSADVEQIHYAHEFNDTETGSHLINVSFYFLNGSLYENQSFTMYHTYNTYSIGDSIIKEGIIQNPKLSINSIEQPYLSSNFTLSEPVYLSKFELFGNFSYLDVLNLNPLSLSVYKIDNTTDPVLLNQTFSAQSTVPHWIEFQSNSSGYYLDKGEYRFVLNATSLTLFPQQTLTIFTTLNNTDGSQYPKVSDNATEWFTLEKNLLFRYTTRKYHYQNLSNVSLTATIFNSTGNPNTINFQTISKTAEFNGTALSQSWFAIDKNFPVLFSSNITCRFNFSYSLVFNYSSTTTPFSFQTSLFQNSIFWQTTFQLQQNESNPILNFTTTEARWMLYFPSQWNEIKAISGSKHYLSTNSSILVFNQSVALLTWNITAHSDFQPINFSIRNQKSQYATGTPIEPIGRVNSTFYNITLSFWNVSYSNLNSPSLDEISEFSYLEYEEHLSHLDQLPNQTIQFPSFTIPENYTDKYVSGRVWWNNATDAGIFLYNFAIRRQAYTEASQLSYDLKLNSWTSPITIRYFSENINITDANVSTTWDLGNWSYSIEEAFYSFAFFAPTQNFTAGTNEEVSIVFTHENFTQATISITLYILIETQLVLFEGKDSIYFNQSLNLEFGWYTSEGNRISSQILDPDRKISIKLDGEPIRSQWWEFLPFQTNSSQPNLLVSIFSNSFASQDYLGYHQIRIELSKRNQSTHFESQIEIYYFEVLPTPSYLSYSQSSAFETRQTENSYTLKEFSNYTEFMEIQVLYEYNATYSSNPNSVIPFNFGSIYGYLLDVVNNIQIGPIYRFTSLYNGISNPGLYQIMLNTSGLRIGSYELFIFSNTTNFNNPTPLIVNLEIIPRWTTNFLFEDPLSIQENTKLNYTARLEISNGTHSWYPSFRRVYYSIEYFGDNSSFPVAIRRSIFTDDNGYFSIKNHQILSWKSYDYFVITIWVEESRDITRNQFSVNINITPNQISRFWKPFLIIIGIALLGVPLLWKVIFPYTFDKLKNSRLINKFERIPAIKQRLEYQKILKNSRNPDPASLEAIQELKIPIVNLDGTSTDCLDNQVCDELDFIKLPPEDQNFPEFRRLGDFINQTIKDIQELFTRQELPERELLAQKDELINTAYVLKHRHEYYTAVLNLLLAYQLAEQLKLNEDLEILKSSIPKLLQKISKVELRFIKRKFPSFFTDK